ncbi:hypothetical protein FEK33_28870 [Nocardia asteroides NBRC 15531]|uniref:Secreted protein n=1 Tax=Nocardia asteroides NBRC 15531 TaxID=1110697 RepID=U5E3W1_NOCAS|nr:hypothetical protein [Nocardia asteroides]TLF62476.1 hypothetical protein FEK33_28870 [Nocardia asteroides NBRC 15531]UGT46687.1 hypothetical protein LT345_19285 [Nocardia asteroides]SFN61434.1 hypothetical protein SAMN05444423_11136 [Nocardia asteroides]VEG34472.1 Uncharacterised protein [Nocardia asteroides]GAD83222.1 hypothetical protein NCAST_18_00740 [Nocardia asteroides NBRC 15531]
MTEPRRSTRVITLAACAAAVLLSAPVAAAEPAVTRDAPAAATAGPGDLLTAYQSVVQTLQALGIQPFLYPTVAANCAGDGLGLVPAVAGAVPGPWPAGKVQIPGLDLNAVKSGQTMFTFLPYGLAPDNPATGTAGMQVAWLNISTGRGGMASMGSIADIVRALVPPEVPIELRPLAETAIRDFLFTAIPVGGVRAVPVDTGRGTVLAAVFGTVDNAGRSCFFFPTIGLTEVP